MLKSTRKAPLDSLLLAAGAMLALAFIAGNAHAQQAERFTPALTTPNSTPSLPDKSTTTAPVPAPPAGVLNPAQEKAQTQAHEQAQILADTRRLFQLAAELKLELVNSSPNTLSLGVVKKAAEIEQLARSLNQRMAHQPS